MNFLARLVAENSATKSFCHPALLRQVQSYWLLGASVRCCWSAVAVAAAVGPLVEPPPVEVAVLVPYCYAM